MLTEIATSDILRATKFSEPEDHEMTPEEFNEQFQGYGNEAYGFWHKAGDWVAGHPKTMIALAAAAVLAAILVF